ncbi:hypothetical protein A4X06_0g9111 [Tilletia controversa]|uniref:Uncharacterized protein n=1 Tax=Tilletia controversa TaxID=13291 RepID=A0A8X7MIV2_9BASI|nr:hypothetical protein CF328_g8506 [Tilletia controversa]KAE8192548.1 hypothetical protein CF336_g4383 [Tilletia laevis]KAE8237782.1 hypothetical protein A4X06_0g9111 [Tilletia controversa]
MAAEHANDRSTSLNMAMFINAQCQSYCGDPGLLSTSPVPLSRSFSPGCRSLSAAEHPSSSSTPVPQAPSSLPGHQGPAHRPRPHRERRPA